MGLPATLARSMMGTPDAVSPELLARHPELGGLVLRRGGLLPRLGGWCLGKATVAGITVGRTVWLAPGAEASAELLLHELCHVHQFEALRAFPLRYWWESLRRGYHQNRFEIDARQFAATRLSGARASIPHPEA